PKRSGLLEALTVLNGVEGVGFCHFEDKDVVRHNLVQRIVRAYETHQREQQLSLGLEGGMDVPATETKPATRKAQ
ncbi:MAG: PhoH family protein, partial [Terriglobus sp.]